MKIYRTTAFTLCKYRQYPDVVRRPGYGNCSRCGQFAELNGGGKNGRKPQFCDACIRGLAERKGVSHG
jgi:hypothetical protein